MRFSIRNPGSIYVFAALLVLAYVAYWPVLNNAPITDDYGHIIKTSWIPLSELWRLFLVQQHTFLRPLPFFSVWVLYKAFGLNWVPQHVLNIGFHAGSAFVFFWLLSRMGIARFTAMLAAMLFVLTPLAPEAVTWTGGRFDVWALFFILLALALYLVSIQKNSRAAFAGSMVAAIAALFSKENAMILIILIPAMEILFSSTEQAAGVKAKRGLNKWRSTGGQRLMIFIAVFAVYMLIRYVIVGGLGGYHGDPLLTTPGIKAIARTGRTLLSPLDYTIFSKTAILLLGSYMGLLCIISLGMVVAGWKTATDAIRKSWVFLAIFFLTTFIPIFPYAFTAGLYSTLMNSRFFYITVPPLMALMVVGLLEFGGKRMRYRNVAVIAIVAIMPVYFWGLRENNSIWEHVASVSYKIPEEALSLVPDPPPGSKFYFQNVPKMMGSHVYASMLPESIFLKYQYPPGPDYYKDPGSREIQVYYFEPDPSLADGLPDVATDPSDGYLFHFDWEDEHLTLVHGPLR